MSNNDMIFEVDHAATKAHQIAAAVLALHDAIENGDASAEAYTPALHLLFDEVRQHAANLDAIAAQ